MKKIYPLVPRAVLVMLLSRKALVQVPSSTLADLKPGLGLSSFSISLFRIHRGSTGGNKRTP